MPGVLSWRQQQRLSPHGLGLGPPQEWLCHLLQESLPTLPGGVHRPRCAFEGDQIVGGPTRLWVHLPLSSQLVTGSATWKGACLALGPASCMFPSCQGLSGFLPPGPSTMLFLPWTEPSETEPK